MEDLLETARIQVERARLEAEKADDEALELKASMMKVRGEAYRNDYAALCEYRRRAEAAEAALAAATGTAKTPQAVECEASQSGGVAASPKGGTQAPKATA